MGAGESEAALARVGASPLFEVGAAIESEAACMPCTRYSRAAPARSAEIEAAYLAGDDGVLIRVQARDYRIDFNLMKQSLMSDPTKTRKVQRSSP